MWPIVGSEEIAAGRLTRAALRWNYTAVHPNVYLPNGALETTSTRTQAAWLWSGRKGIIAGRSAAYLHGVYWAADSAPIELIGRHRRPTRGVVIRDERIGDDEVSGHGGQLVTTAARTALDLARHLPRAEAVAILDALSARSGVTAADVQALADRYPGARGLPAARLAVNLMDGGAMSREETALRLYLIDSVGLPRPTTDIRIGDKYGSTRIAMGWEWAKVGISWQEPEERLERYSAVQRLRAEEVVQRLGWLHIRAHPLRALHSVRFQAQTALRSRGR
ncbi:hypothetical protein [Mycolicibacterium baixiangningiae]|uniref:hypothetical protein n=1 Tax=Mycolicibacterium baixiangningiae TaxID=2761578 RepID=UPI0018D039D2|nr:hypothetical protein [Mycolicibacterium baixiangningiae]